MTNIQEAKLAMRLSALREDAGKAKELVDLDEFNLLRPAKKPESIDEIFADDDLDILVGADADSIFNLKHVPQTIDMPDYVARRKPCDDFDQFEDLFFQCHADLQAGKRTLRPFAKEQQIKQGQFFALKGVLTYIANVGEKEKTGGKTNARLRCIFENGTESDMLLRSLARELYKDGRRVTESEDRLMDDPNNVFGEDSQTGHIYVLRSLSTNPDIALIRDLYKIGFSTLPVEERIKNAEDDPTYLMAPVHLVEIFECFNLNPQKLELLLHKFFGKVCLEVDVFDTGGKRYTPREWFIVPLPVIAEALELIISGEIVDFAYDHQNKLIYSKGGRAE
ncbi:MAG: GIY-YIG nuclease family protein [Desulfuromonas sp.]|nr:GIY-YIG nuclease family protein [Desulfuromonas sp.]